MNLLWSLEELTRWSSHDSTDVRHWALRNLKEHYPRQSGAALAARLGDGDPEITLMAAGHFVDFPDARFADALLAAFEGAEDPDLRGSCAQALAAIHDDRFAQRYWEAHCFGKHPLRDDPGVLEASMRLRFPAARQWLRHFVAEAAVQARRASVKGELKEIGARLDAAAEFLLLGNPLEEIPFLLAHYLRWPNHELLGYRLLRALTAAAGDYSTALDFEEETRRSKPSRLSLMEEAALEDLISSGETELASRARRLLKEGDDLSFISLVASRAEALLEEECGGMAEERRTAWLGSGQIPAFNLQLLRSLCTVRSEIASARKPVRHRLAMLALSTFCRYAMCRPLLGRSFAELATAQKIQFLLKDRYGLREDDDWILQIGPGDATLTELEHCSWVLEDDGHRAQGRAATLTGHLRHAPALPILLDLLGTEDDLLWEDLLNGASRFGAAVVPFMEQAAAREGSSERLMQMLPLLGRLPCRETEEFLVRHFSWIYELDVDSAQFAAETFGTRSMIPLIRSVMKQGEPEERIFALLCQLHDVAAPELPSIIESLTARRQESKRRFQGLSEGNPRAALFDTVPLELKCKRCGRAYHYDVQRVHVDAKAPPKENIFIQDSIVCKNCGAADSYEITGGATLAIMGALLTSSFAAKAGQGDPREGPVRMIESTVDGKRMSIAQGEDYYQKLIAQEPNRSELRVGYGNLLRNLHRPEQACREYEKALELDPLAVEAWVGLGEIENKAGNLRHARDFYSRALDIFDRGNFYRLTVHPDDLREQLEINVDRLREQSLDSEPEHSFQEDWTPPVAKPLDVGRNDPCPCGSGKKYKKCCLGKKTPAATTAVPNLPKTMTTAAEARLQQRLTEFSSQPRFKRQFDQALQMFFSGMEVVGEDYVPSQADLGHFIEWFIHDYVQESGDTLLEIFQRTDGRLLPVTERAILDEQRKSVLSVYEVLEVHPERAEICLRNLFTDEEFVAHDVAGSRQLVQWDLIISRLMRIEGRLRLSGIISTLAPAQRHALLRYANLELDVFRRETGQRGLNVFLKARGYCLHQFVRAEQHRYRPMPELQTSDHHSLLFCKGVYRVQNYHGTAFRLKEAPDFELEQPASRGPANALRFAWLERGPSRELIPQGGPTGGIQIHASRLATQHSHPVSVLGAVTLNEDEMVLETLSRERLEAGKQRIETLLGGYIAFKLDTLQSPVARRDKAARDASHERTAETRVPTESERRVVESLLRNHYERWIDEPLPALDGKTPRQAAATAEGRTKIEDLIKSIENSEARKRLNQEPSVDLSFLRQRLSATAK